MGYFRFGICFFIIILLIGLSYQTEPVYLTINNFNEFVVKSNELWVIECFSHKCETCMAFEKTWEDVTKKLDNLKIGRINIDDKNGMDLAMKLNFLDEGVPNVRLYLGDNVVSIMKGSDTLLNQSQLKRKINQKIKENFDYNKSERKYNKKVDL